MPICWFVQIISLFPADLPTLPSLSASLSWTVLALRFLLSIYIYIYIRLVVGEVVLCDISDTLAIFNSVILWSTITKVKENSWIWSQAGPWWKKKCLITLSIKLIFPLWQYNQRQICSCLVVCDLLSLTPILWCLSVLASLFFAKSCTTGSLEIIKRKNLTRPQARKVAMVLNTNWLGILFKCSSINQREDKNFIYALV